LPLFDSRAALYGLMAILTMVVLIGHHAVPPMDRDESRFAQASRQMVQSGDYITVKFQDELRAKKPAGIYWAQSFFASLFGTDDIASYRFVNLLALLAAVFMLYHIGLRLYEPRAALAAAALLGSSFIVLGEAHLAKTDSVLMALALAQQGALLTIYRVADTEIVPPRYSWFWFWVAMAVGVLVKGPVLPVLAVLTVTALSLWHRDVGWLAGLRPVYGVGLVMVICLPWAIMVSAATGGAFLDLAFKGDFLAKVKSGQESHGVFPGAFLLLLPVLVWPGTPLLVTAASGMRGLLAGPTTRFLVAWLIPFWVMLELVPTKLPHYILPVLPALCLILAGRVIAPLPPSLPQSRGWLGPALRYLGVAVGFGFAVVAFWGAMVFGGTDSRAAMLYAMLVLLLALVAMMFGHYWISRGLWAPFFAMLAAGLLLHLVFFAGLVPSLSRLHVSKAVAGTIAAMPSGRPVVMAAAGYHEPSLVFQLGRDLLLVDGREAALFLAEAPAGLAIIEQRQKALFLQTAQALKLQLADPQQIDGFNISKGRSVSIFLYRTDMFDAKAPKG
jgi:4-amino-4-deoxy-L-arabinose transferase-like glycosyltransferase